MERKKLLQIIFGVIFALLFLGFLLYSVNQIQLNSQSKVIIGRNNALMESFNTQAKESLKSFENLDSLKIDAAKETQLKQITEGFPALVENTQNQLQAGVNAPSTNNYNLAITKLNNSKKTLEELNALIMVKLCIRDKYTAYTSKLTAITSLQDDISKASSFAQSKELVTNLRAAYSDLITSSQDLPGCITLDKLKDLKDSISKSIEEDKASIETYQTTYIDPLLELYVAEDSAKISEFIDSNSNVSVKLNLPNLFDNSLEMSVADKIIEDQITSNTSSF